ncbi:MAG: CRTAC1 family protein, partial [Planctomycetes bacterium]|nr:CRTAC1 family protein [Planctomycetota bacterium]
NDGDLDLMVCNYVKWSRQIDTELAFSMNGRDRAYGPPIQYQGSFPYLYRNDGGGRFTDVSAAAGVQVKNPATGAPVAKSLALVFFDFDRDGFADVLIANDTVQNFLFHNRRDGTFAEIGLRAGIGFDAEGRATGAMGIDAARFRDGESVGVAIGNFANEMTSLFVSGRDPLQFSDQAASEGIGAPSRLSLSFGLFFFDYDLDGRLDLLQANGHIEDAIQQVQPSQHYAQPAQLFWNQGPAARCCFVPIPADTVGDLAQPMVARGAAYADIDGDLDLDVLLVQLNGPPRLLRNEQQLGHHALRLVLRGTRSNRNAIGARVIASFGGQTVEQTVAPTRSYLSQVELPVTIGLGTHRAVDQLTIHWPGGAVQKVPVRDLHIDGTTQIVEPR